MLLASLLVASFVIFGALYLAPGNPIAALSGGRALPASSLRVLEQRYHLNEPFLAQYWYWLDDALHGNLGISITLRENVSTLIGVADLDHRRAGAVRVADDPACSASASASSRACGPACLDTSVLVTTAVSAAIPSFVAAIVLILVFSVKLRLVPGARQRRPASGRPAALHAARGRAGDLLAGDRRPGHPGGDPRGSRPRARADRDQPRHPGRAS